MNCDINPTDAVAIGAAYYAGMHEKKLEVVKTPAKQNGIRVRMIFDRFTQESEVMFAARVEGDIKGLTYRITREDGGFDSGNKPMVNRINEDLPLVLESYNVFQFRVFDKMSNPVPTDADLITISQGIIPPPGPPLPKDICLEFDSHFDEGTELHLLFPKGSTLPQRRKVRPTVTKTVLKDSHEDIIHINVYQGPHDTVPAANVLIGDLKISGDKVRKDILKGSEIELTIEITESQELKVEAYVEAIDQVFSKVSTIRDREVNIERINEELSELEDQVEESLTEAVESENFELAQSLRPLQKEVTDLHEESELIAMDDVTDAKFPLDDRKRGLVQRIEKLTPSRKLGTLQKEFEEAREKAVDVVGKHGNDAERRALKEVLAREAIISNTTNPQKIKGMIGELSGLTYSILWRVPDFLKGMFGWLSKERSLLNNPQQAGVWLESGKRAIADEDFDKLGMINQKLLDLLPDRERAEAISRTRITII